MLSRKTPGQQRELRYVSKPDCDPKHLLRLLKYLDHLCMQRSGNDTAASANPAAALWVMETLQSGDKQ